MRTAKLGAEAVQTEKGGVVTVAFPRFGDPASLRHAVSTRLGGVSGGKHASLNLSLKVGDDPVRVLENRELLGKASGMSPRKTAFLDQVHGDKVLKVEEGHFQKLGTPLGEGDGIICDHPRVPLALMVADCLPVLFHDPVHKAIGLAHAGWRGTVEHVAAKTLLAMGEAYGTKPEETRVVLGPAIGPCCYEVGGDVKAEFEKVFPWAPEVFKPAFGKHWRLDIPESNARQLLEVGVKEENLIRSGLCTVEHLDLFYSHRAEASPEQPTGRVGAFLMLVD